MGTKQACNVSKINIQGCSPSRKLHLAPLAKCAGCKLQSKRCCSVVIENTCLVKKLMGSVNKGKFILNNDSQV